MSESRTRYLHFLSILVTVVGEDACKFVTTIGGNTMWSNRFIRHESQTDAQRVRMHRSGAVGAAIVVAAFVLASCASNSSGSEETLTFTQAEDGAVFTPIGTGTGSDTSVSPGSGIALSAPLQDSSKNTVGELNAICMASKPSKGLFGVCTGTADVPGGQLAIVFGGQVYAELNGSIVGGTGKYIGATGNFVGGGPGALTTFNISLP